MQKITDFLKREAVLCIAAVAALVSAFFVPPDAEYIGYIDIHVLILLFCLMAVVAGAQKCGLFIKLARRLCEGERSLKSILFILVLLPFFASMLITNDVALITFVPFAILVLNEVGKREYLIFTIVMQTIAANLGSMATPVGNPQNLYLYSRFFTSISEFSKVVLPAAGISLIVICVALMFVKRERVSVTFNGDAEGKSPKKLFLWLALFVLCLLSVFHILNDWVLLLATIASLIIFDRELFRNVDFALLLTFVCFFIFAGNIARIDAIRLFLEEQMTRNAGLTTALASQIISNVPAAVMLSNFTSNGIKCGKRQAIL